jgi:hypothetical protein
MQLERGGHGHVALVADEHDTAPSAVSLLRLSVPARLIMVAIAAALLWGSVRWALACLWRHPNPPSSSAT